MAEHKGHIKINNIDYTTLALFSDELYKDNNVCWKINNEPNNKTQFLKKMYVPTDNNISDYNSWKNSLNIENPENAKLYKYRYYLKVVENEDDLNNKDRILTFVLFNPSYANQYTLDDTIENCRFITFDYFKKENIVFTGFEILNLLNIRTTSTKKLKENDYNNIELYDNTFANYISFNDVVLAWGVSKNKNTFRVEMNKTWKTLCKLKEDCPKCRAIFYKTLDYTQPRTWHLGKQGWSSKGKNLQNDLGSENLKIVEVRYFNEIPDCTSPLTLFQ